MTRPGRPVSVARIAVVAAVVTLLALMSFAPDRARAQFIVLGRPGSLISERFVTIGFSGSVAITFQGDPVTCASRGVCGYSGTIIWRPGVPNGAAAIELLTAREHGRIVRTAGFSTFSNLAGPATVSAVVRRALAGAGAATCGDASNPDTSSTLRRRGSSLEVRVIGGASSVLSTRCAGPLDGDVARAMPVRTIAIASLAHRGGLIDLRGTHTFAGGGFAGTVTSTLVLHQLGGQLLRPHVQRGSRVRIVSLPLTIDQPAATLTATITGSTVADVCATLDSCGAHGTLGLSLHPATAHTTLLAVTSVRRPYRDSLAALGLSRHGNPAGIDAFADVGLGGPAGVRTAWTAPSACRDAGQTGPGDVGLMAVGGRLIAGYAPAGGLRLRCPGPELVSATGGAIAGTRTSVATLSRHSFTLSLRHTAGVSDDGYTARITGSLPLVVRTGKVSQRIVRSLTSTEVIGAAARRSPGVS